MSGNGPGLLVIERILRNRQSIWQQIVQERDLNRITMQMMASSAIALACYGAVLGAFHSFLMAATSAVKLPLLFLVTLAICLPTLYLFNLVFGARLSVRQALALVMVAITVTSMLAVAFAPISLFFLITAPDYGFFKLLNVAILALSAFVGLRFLTGGMQVLNDSGLLAPAVEAEAALVPAPGAASAVEAAPAPAVAEASTVAPVPAAAAVTTAPAQAVPADVVPAAVNGGSPATAVVPALPAAPANPAPVSAVPAGPPARMAPHPGPGFWSHTYPPGHPGHRPAPVGRQPKPKSMTLLYIWILLFGFVGTQLAWTLRPFFGSPGEGFALFRSIEGNFYAEILRTIANLF